MIYNGYKITRTPEGNYRVKTPRGVTFTDEAANLTTAKKWADADRIERAAKLPERTNKPLLFIVQRYSNRVICEWKGQLYRRFSASVWQERIHTGEFHNIVDPVRAQAMEAIFQLVKDQPATTFDDATGTWSIKGG